MPASEDSYTPCDISSRTACKREALRHISAYAADEPQRDSLLQQSKKTNGRNTKRKDKPELDAAGS